MLDIVYPPLALDPPPARGTATAAPPQTQGLTPAAWSRITFLEAPVCDGCGAGFEYDLGPGVRCAACQARPRAFDRARAACVYDEASRELILQFKHADRTDLAPLFTAWVGRAAAPLLADVDALQPVPLHPSRLFARRYNQAAEIARPLARRAGLDYLADALVRRRDTAGQGGRSASGRRRNVAGAFIVPEARRRHIEGRRILLIDDVLTTGATAEACARALKAAGAAAVHLAVIARVKEAANLSI